MFHLSETKKTFLLGLTTGLSIVFFAGFMIMTVAYFQKGVEKEDVVDIDQVKGVDNDADKYLPDKLIDVNVSKDDRILGDKDAPITIVEFSDLQCPYCSKFHTTMNQIARDFKGQVRWVYKHFPLESIHPFAKKAALATECAGDQGKFWEYTNHLFENQSKINNEFLKESAKNLKLDSGKFDKCLDGEKYLSKVNNDIAEGKKAGVAGTPASFINGKLIKGAESYETIKRMIGEASK